jgi:hypothetical protein
MKFSNIEDVVSYVIKEQNAIIARSGGQRIETVSNNLVRGVWVRTQSFVLAYSIHGDASRRVVIEVSPSSLRSLTIEGISLDQVVSWFNESEAQ